MTIESFGGKNQEDRSYDHSWIADNHGRFAPLAREGFALVGRGLVLANLKELILRKYAEEGHPHNYHAPSSQWFEDEEITPESILLPLLPLLVEYAPDKEFVLLLVKHNHPSLHRVPIVLPGEFTQETRRADAKAEAEERQARLSCTDFWAREYSLTTPHTAEWLYRVAGLPNR